MDDRPDVMELAVHPVRLIHAPPFCAQYILIFQGFQKRRTPLFDKIVRKAEFVQMRNPSAMDRPRNAKETGVLRQLRRLRVAAMIVLSDHQNRPRAARTPGLRPESSGDRTHGFAARPIHQRKTPSIRMVFRWSRVRESNPPPRLGKPLYYRCTNPACSAPGYHIIF